MLIIAYVLGGWVLTNAYVRFLKKKGVNRMSFLRLLTIRDNDFGKNYENCKAKPLLHRNSKNSFLK